MASTDVSLGMSGGGATIRIGLFERVLYTFFVYFEKGALSNALDER